LNDAASNIVTIFLTSTDAASRETSALLSLSNDKENNGDPKTGPRPASSAPATFPIRRIFGLETSSTHAKGLILRTSALETHSAGPHSSRHNNNHIK